MEIVRIFADHYLYAVRYDPNDPDEFEKLFNSWNDIEHLEEFFEKNIEDLESDFFKIPNVEDAVLSTISQARNLEQKLKTLSDLSNEDLAESLDTLFHPLDSKKIEIELAKSKAYGLKHKSWLRVYAIKVGSELYIITGGAIKLTSTMNDREHTLKELRKLTRTVDFLKEQGIIDKEGFEELEI